MVIVVLTGFLVGAAPWGLVFSRWGVLLRSFFGVGVTVEGLLVEIFRGFIGKPKFIINNRGILRGLLSGPWFGVAWPFTTRVSLIFIIEAEIIVLRRLPVPAAEIAFCPRRI